MSMVKSPAEIHVEALATAMEAPGTDPGQHTVRAALRRAGRRLVRTRLMVKLGEMADRVDLDTYAGTERRFCSMCRPH